MTTNSKTNQLNKSSFVCGLCTRVLDEECLLCQRATHNFPGFIPKVETPNFPDINFRDLTQAELEAILLYVFQGGERDLSLAEINALVFYILQGGEICKD